MHRSSSRKRCFVLEGEGEVLAYRLLPSEGMFRGTENLTLLSMLCLVVVDWRKGLSGRRLAEQRQGSEVEARPGLIGA